MSMICVSSCRRYEDEHKCSDHVCFHVITTEKGDKNVANIEPLLKLPPCEKLAELIKTAENNHSAGAKANPVKAMLGDITTDDFRAKFKCHFWGELSFSDLCSHVIAPS